MFAASMFAAYEPSIALRHATKKYLRAPVCRRQFGLK